MKKRMKRLSVLGLMMLFLSLSPSIGFAEDGQLLYDLRYDEGKSVLYGKTKPNANVYINDLAGSIVADDKGEFEMPVPKGLKVSTVLMLDAEGDTSTDLRFNFEKNTIETEESSKASGQSSSSSSSISSEKKKDEESKGSDKKDSSEKESKESSTTESSTKESSTTESSSKEVASISSESYNPEAEKPEKRSLIWLWTLLGVIAVLGSAIGGYFWYKKKLEKEEAKRASRKKRHSKSKGKRRRDLDDDFEEDLYASLKDTGKEDSNPTLSESLEELSSDELDLDKLIEAELQKKPSSSRHKKHRSSSGSSSSKKRKKKRSNK